MKDLLELFVIYQNPSDFRGKFVVRGQVAQSDGSIRPNKEPLGVVESLDEARSLVPAGLVNLGRSDEDDPVIVECWV